MDWFMRKREDMHIYGKKECPNYTDPDYFTIKMYHSGEWDEHMSSYKFGKIDYFDCCNVDRISLLEIHAMHRECGEVKGGCLMCWYKKPTTSMVEGLTDLLNDVDVMKLAQLLDTKIGYMEVYVSVVSKPLNVEGLPIKSSFEPFVDVEHESMSLEEINNRSAGKGKRSSNTKKKTQKKKESGANSVNERAGETTKKRSRNKGDGEDDSFAEQNGNESSVDDESEVSWHGDSSNLDETDDDIYFEEYVDEYGAEKDDNELQDGYDDASTDYGSSSDERMAVSSNDEEEKKSYVEFNEKIVMADPEFQLGMLFANGQMLRTAVRTHAIRHRRPIKRQKNMGSKIQYVCTGGCKWKIYANKCQRSDTYQIRTFIPEHTCQQTFHQKLITVAWIARAYEDEIRMNPTWDIEAFHRKLVNDLKCHLRKSMVYRAKHMALKVIHGSHEKQYEMLWDYGHELRRVMPDSSVVVEMEEKEPGQDRGRFNRMYICLGPIKKGFMEGCRPLVGFDGCHLKGPFGGQLLSAVGIDPNEGMYPIAWAIVQAENYDNWLWFMNLLKGDINIVNDRMWTFISDKQKGLVNAVETIFPNAEHRFCVMHLYRNMWKDHKGIGLRTLLWKSARSTTDYLFEKNMAELKKVSRKCYDWLMDKPKSQWSRSAFRSNCLSDMFVNNHCEVFNSSITKYRHLPIITMFKELHRALMIRIQKRRDKMLPREGSFCTTAMKKLNKAIARSADALAEWSGGPRFLVTTTSGGYEMVVDIFNKTCACNKWQLSGIPCFHAVACYHSRNMDPVQGIHQCYNKQMYLKVYGHILEPINGEEHWESTPYPKPLPPNVKTAPGRPKKRSRKNDTPVIDPTKLKRESTSLRCSHCKDYGHNKRTCATKRNDDKVKEGETLVETGRGNNETVGGINGTSDKQVEVNPGASQPVDNLQESQELPARPPIARSTTVKTSNARHSSAGPTVSKQVQGGVFNRPFIRPGMAKQASNSLGPEPRYFLHKGQKVTTRHELQRAANVTKNQM